MDLESDMWAHPAGEVKLYLPVRSMNSVPSAKARAVKGSNVESVRVANDIVNMLLRFPSDFHTSMGKKIRNLLQGIASGKMRWIDW